MPKKETQTDEQSFEDKVPICLESIESKLDFIVGALTEQGGEDGERKRNTFDDFCEAAKEVLSDGIERHLTEIRRLLNTGDKLPAEVSYKTVTNNMKRMAKSGAVQAVMAGVYRLPPGGEEAAA